MDLARSPQKCLSVRLRGREGGTRRRNPVPSFLPSSNGPKSSLTCSLSLPQSLLRPLPYSPQECYIPCLSRSLAGFTTQFEEPPYRAPSSTLLAPEYSENSEATDADDGQHMSTEFLRDPRNEHGTLNPGNCLRCTHPLADPLSCWSLGNPRSGLRGPDTVLASPTDPAEAGPVTAV